jgi:hypothetical protein
VAKRYFPPETFDVVESEATKMERIEEAVGVVDVKLASYDMNSAGGRAQTSLCNRPSIVG